jgi:GNAT superfamily N-acetyltransferase
MLRIAKIEDKEVIKELLNKFIEDSPYKNFPLKEEVFSKYIELFLEDASGGRVCILDEEDGEVVAVGAVEVVPWLFTELMIARELAVYVTPKYRKKGIGKDIIAAIEFWASKVGCQFVQLSTLRKDCDKLYKELGYEITESIYLKSVGNKESN